MYVLVVQPYMGTIEHKEAMYNDLNILHLYPLKSKEVHTWLVFQNQVIYMFIQIFDGYIATYFANAIFNFFMHDFIFKA